MLPEAPPHPNQIKVYGTLIHAARRGGLDSALRLWHIARAYDTAGRGVVALQYLTALAREHTGLSRKQVSRLLVKGEGRLWRRGSKELSLIGLKQVAINCACEHLSQAVYIPTEALKSLIDWRATGGYVAYIEAYATSNPLHKRTRYSRPISRRTIGKALGVGDRTQRRYHARAGRKVAHKRNLAATNTDWPQSLNIAEYNALQRRYGEAGQQARAYLPIAIDNGPPKVAYALPNSYRTTLTATPKGMATRVNATLANLFTNSHTGYNCKARRRVFYESGEDATQAAGRIADRVEKSRKGGRLTAATEPATLYAATRHRSRTGAILWQRTDV